VRVRALVNGEIAAEKSERVENLQQF